MVKSQISFISKYNSVFFNHYYQKVKCHQRVIILAKRTLWELSFLMSPSEDMFHFMLRLQEPEPQTRERRAVAQITGRWQASAWKLLQRKQTFPLRPGAAPVCAVAMETRMFTCERETDSGVGKEREARSWGITALMHILRFWPRTTFFFLPSWTNPPSAAQILSVCKRKKNAFCWEHANILSFSFRLYNSRCRSCCGAHELWLSWGRCRASSVSLSHKQWHAQRGLPSNTVWSLVERKRGSSLLAWQTWCSTGGWLHNNVTSSERDLHLFTD